MKNVNNVFTSMHVHTELYLIKFTCYIRYTGLHATKSVHHTPVPLKLQPYDAL